MQRDRTLLESALWLLMKGCAVTSGNAYVTCQFFYSTNTCCAQRSYNGVTGSKTTKFCLQRILKNLRAFSPLIPLMYLTKMNWQILFLASYSLTLLELPVLHTANDQYPVLVMECKLPVHKPRQPVLRMATFQRQKSENL